MTYLPFSDGVQTLRITIVNALLLDRCVAQILYKTNTDGLLNLENNLA